MNTHCTIEHKQSEVFIKNETKIKWVALITLITMIGEIGVGYWSGSMALLADGWHMASHALAMFLSLFVYYLYRHPTFRNSFTFGGGKILSLGGYTSALFLVLIALSMIVESIGRFNHAEDIYYKEAIGVAIIGLFVNLLCAWILGHDHHDHGHGHSHSHHSHDHNHSHDHDCDHHEKSSSNFKDHTHESTYVHVLTDALTSILAIVALLLGMWKGWRWLDPAVGILGGIVVLVWAVGLIKQSGKDLLDAHVVELDKNEIVSLIQKDGSEVVDIHLWRLAPDQIGCEIMIKPTQEERKSSDYRNILLEKFDIQHLIIEIV
ncbi:MAG TPA: CDF family Co(II)/Ni(II) efflux transporter DmeF [Bacteriovoracaceae bacterium]|nr:CDF family Co(II)/Ni(II) efflux transporter DmeF [Bacteriovoracaceae bacterium]